MPIHGIIPQKSFLIPDKNLGVLAQENAQNNRKWIRNILKGFTSDFITLTFLSIVLWKRIFTIMAAAGNMHLVYFEEK